MATEPSSTEVDRLPISDPEFELSAPPSSPDAETSDQRPPDQLQLDDVLVSNTRFLNTHSAHSSTTFLPAHSSIAVKSLLSWHTRMEASILFGVSDKSLRVILRAYTTKKSSLCAPSTGCELKVRNNGPTNWLDSACQVKTSRRHLFPIRLGIQRCQTSQQQTWYPSKQVKGESSATTETPAWADPMRTR